MKSKLVGLKINVSFFLLILCIGLHAATSLLPSDYQNKLLVPEPVLEEINVGNKALLRHVFILQENIYLGDSLFIAGQLDAACSKYKNALKNAQILNSNWAKVICYNRMGFARYWLNEFNESCSLYRNSVSIIDQESEIRDSIANMEAHLFLKITESENSWIQHNINYNIKVSSLPDEDSIINQTRKMKYFYLQSRYNLLNNDYNQLKITLDKEKKILRNAKTSSAVWIFYFRLFQAKYYMGIFDFPLVKQYYLELQKQVENDPSFNVYKYYIYFGFFNLYVRSYDCVKAEYYSNKILSYLQNRNDICFYSDFLLIGFNYQQLGKNDLALINYKRAETILIRNNINDGRLAMAYWYIAYYHSLITQDVEKQLYYLTNAKKILTEYPDLQLNTYISDALGRLFDLTEGERTIAILNPILSNLDRLLDDEEYFQIQYPYIASSAYQGTLNTRNRAYYFLSKRKNYDTIILRQSFIGYQKALKLSLKIFDKRGFEDSKISTLNEIRRKYDNVFNVGYSLFEHTGNRNILTQLFNYAEDSKAYLLKNYISDETVQKISGIPEQEWVKGNQLSEQIDTLLYVLSRNQAGIPDPNENFLIDKVLEKSEEYDNHIRKLEHLYPKYASMKQEKTAISIDQIQHKLDSSQAILEYFFTFNSLYIFYIDRYIFEIFYQPIDASFTKNILEFRKNFEGFVYGDYSRGNLEKYSKQAYELYKLVIKPVENRIEGKSLLIIPDAELGYIPFETLCTENPDSARITSFSDLPYLIISNPISYLYSVYQIRDKSNQTTIKAKYRAFAPQYRIKNNNGKSQELLYELPGAKEEVLSAKKYYGGSVFLGEQANKASFFRAIQKNGIVHLAMHALLDEEEPRRSVLLFSEDIKDDEKQLHTYEVYSQDILSSLVVLSACNTGVGKMNRGEGIFSIARSFLQAGIKNVIYTQWSVTDRSSAQLMNYFYKYLADGLPIDESMQKAKIDFLQKGDPAKAHPYYWAGYVNMGVPVCLPAKSNFTWYFIAGFLICGLILLIVLIRKKN